MAKVVFILGSESDKKHSNLIDKHLKSYGIKSVTIVSSAHKAPEKLLKHIEKYNKEANIIFITIAGRSNGLSGVTAGSTHHPVIACPPLANIDDYNTNINSTIQMPSKVPVLTVLDPENAALAVLRIFALQDEKLNKLAKKILQETKSKYE